MLPMNGSITSSEDTEVKGIYTFSLDWSKASQPTVTVTRAEKADATTLTLAQTGQIPLFRRRHM